MFGLFKKSRPVISLEEQIEVLKGCGITFPAGFTADKATTEWSRAQYEQDPYKVLLVYLGGEEPLADVGADWPARSEQLWHFDVECIEDSGSYKRIAKRLSELAGGDLPLQNISDEVDVDEERAVLRFDLDGKAYEWQLKVNDDWVDPAVFDQFCKLLKSRTPKGEFTYLDLEGQDCVIGYASTPNRLRFNQATGLNFKPLTEAKL